MKAMVIDRICRIEKEVVLLAVMELPDPKVGEHDILIQVRVCGVCHTELDEDANQALRELKQRKIRGAKVW